MKKLRTYFDNAFDDAKISDRELRSFAEDHLNRLSAANTNGSYTTLLTTTQTAFTAFSQAQQREDEE